MTGIDPSTREESRRLLYLEVSRAASIGLGVNLALGLAKLIGGIAGHSFALVSDAVNSLGDVVASVVVLVAVKFAQRPPDSEHPYGHTRAEAVAGLCVALLVITSALAIGWEALTRVRVEAALPQVWTLWIAAFNVVIKETLYQYGIRVGRRTGSVAIKANAWDHRADAFSALAVLVGLALIRIGGERYLIADRLAALVVVAAILSSATGLFRESLLGLLDTQAEEDLIKQIDREAREEPGILGVETLWVRKSGLEYFADIHIEVDSQTTVAEGHAIGHRVKDRLLSRFPALRDVLVHLEPHEPPEVST